MTSQNLNINPNIRSSGHKEATEEHATVAAMKSRGDGGNPEALLNNRILSHDQVSRAALWDHDDFLCVASSKKRFDIDPDNVRKLLDGLLTFSRVGDPTAAGGAGKPPEHFNLGNEGHATVKEGDADRAIAELDGKMLFAARTATYVLLVEGKEGANQSALDTTVRSFQEGLQQLTL